MLANQISQAIAIVQQGGVIAYSTETILGLGCDPNNRRAVERLLWLKQRSINKGLVILVASVDALKEHSQPLSPSQYAKITSRLSKAPTTWVLPAHRSTPIWIMGNHGHIAIRITQHTIASKLCASTGAIVSTSANYSDYPTAINSQQLREWFGPYLDYVIIGAPGTGVPSEIRDLVSGEILRQTSKSHGAKR